MILRDAGEARILRAVMSRRQLQEVMVDFWFNHFNVFSEGADRYLDRRFREPSDSPFRARPLPRPAVCYREAPAMLAYLTIR